MLFLRKLISLIFAFCACLSLHSQNSIEGSFGLTRNGYFHFDKATQSTKVDEQVGQILTIAFSHDVGDKTLLKYGLVFERYRGKYRTENIDGKSSFGSSLSMDVAYLGLRIGGEERIIEKNKFISALTIHLSTGFQLKNRTTGTSYEFIPVKIDGPNNDKYSILIRDDKEYKNENLDQIKSFYIGFELGFMVGYQISDKVSLQFIPGYSVSITPFFEEMPSNLWRNSLQFRLGASFSLSRGNTANNP